MEVLDSWAVTQSWSIVADRLGEEKFVAEWNQATKAERSVLQTIAKGEPASRVTRWGGTFTGRLVAKGRCDLTAKRVN